MSEVRSWKISWISFNGDREPDLKGDRYQFI
jgi:hypothetical protein